MRKTIVLLLLFLISCALLSAQALPDSVYMQYKKSKGFVAKGKALQTYYSNIKGSSSEKLHFFSGQLSYFKKKNDPVGIAYTKLNIVVILGDLGDLDGTLKYGFSALPLFEQGKDTLGILTMNTEIAYAYSFSHNEKESLKYLKAILPIAKKHGRDWYTTILNNTADSYNNMKQPEIALGYIQQAVAIDIKDNNSYDLASCLSTLGETYIALQQHEKGREVVRQAIVLLKNTSQTSPLAYSYKTMAKSFYQTSDYDNALDYGYKCLSISNKDYLLVTQDCYETMSEIYEKKQQTDSAYKYFKLKIAVKDSLFSMRKSQNIQASIFNEQMRQEEIETRKKELAAAHTKNLENTLIALGIICFTVLFLVLSRRLIANVKIIKFLGAAALLLVFEFINLLIHSFLEDFTGHSQILMLLALVCLAAMLIPMHHKIEHWAVNRLIEKNQQLRMALEKTNSDNDASDK